MEDFKVIDRLFKFYRKIYFFLTKNEGKGGIFMEILLIFNLPLNRELLNAA